MSDKRSGRNGWGNNDASREKREPITEDPATYLACAQFVTDPRSGYCLRCGYLPRDHKHSLKASQHIPENNDGN